MARTNSAKKPGRTVLEKRQAKKARRQTRELESRRRSALERQP